MELMCTAPVSICRAMRSPRWRFSVKTAEARPGLERGGEVRKWKGKGGGCQLTIFSIIRNLNCLFIILYHKQRNCRAETFLIVEICIFLHIFENHGSHGRGEFAFIVDVAVNGFGAFGDGIR